MRQSGDGSERPLDPGEFQERVRRAVKKFDIERAREEIVPFVFDRRSVEIWSEDFFTSLIDKVELV